MATDYPIQPSRSNWTFISCERFEYRSEATTDRGLKPLPRPGARAGEIVHARQPRSCRSR